MKKTRTGTFPSPTGQVMWIAYEEPTKCEASMVKNEKYLSEDVLATMRTLREAGHIVRWGYLVPLSWTVVQIDEKYLLFENDKKAIEYLTTSK